MSDPCSDDCRQCPVWSFGLIVLLVLVAALLCCGEDALAQTQTLRGDALRLGPDTVPADATKQIRVGVDGSNYCNLTVGATGTATWDCTGSATVDTITFTDGIQGPITLYGDVTLGNDTSGDELIFNARIQSSLIFETTNQYDIGESGTRVKDIWLSGDANVGDDVTIDGGNLTTTSTSLTINPVGASSNLVLAPGADVEVNPTGNDVLPTNNYDINLGSLTKKFATLFASELLVETLVAADVMATVGGRVLVGPTTVLTSDLEASGGSSSTLDTSIVAWWKLDEAGSASTWNDEVGTNDMTRNGTLTSTAGGKPSSGNYVTGWSSGTTGAHLSMADNANFNSGDNDFSASAWVYTGTIAWQPVFIKWNGTTGTSIKEWWMGTNASGYPYVRISQDGNGDTGSPACEVSIASAISSNTWTMLTGGWNATDNKLWVSVNGGAKTQSSACSYTPTDRNGVFEIGADVGGYTNGRVDGVGFWNKMLSDSEISELYASAAGKDYPFGSAGGTINVKHNNLSSGDFIYLEKGGNIEWMKVTSASSGSGPYTYNVDRSVDPGSPQAWLSGDAVFSTDNETDKGWIDLFANTGMRGGAAGPTIVGHVRTGTTTYDQTEPRWVLGNLNGFYGYSSTTWGTAFGDYGASSNINVTIDPTNGFRIRDNATDIFRIEADGDLWVRSASSDTTPFKFNFGTTNATTYLGTRYYSQGAIPSTTSEVSISTTANEGTQDEGILYFVAQTNGSGRLASVQIRASEYYAKDEVTVNADQINLSADTLVTGYAQASTGFKEWSRTPKVGDWTSVSYSSGNFTASSGNWTVESGEQIVYAYTLVGHTMTLAFQIDGSDTSTTPATIRIAVPNGGTEADVVARQVITPIRVRCGTTDGADDINGWRTGFAQSVVDTSLIYLNMDQAGSAWCASTGNVTVQGQITFEVK